MHFKANCASVHRKEQKRSYLWHIHKYVGGAGRGRIYEAGSRNIFELFFWHFDKQQKLADTERGPLVCRLECIQYLFTEEYVIDYLSLCLYIVL